MDKRMALASLGGQIHSGDTIALGGGGLMRKPMALVEEILRSDITDLTVVAVLGGPDVDLLLGAGRVKKLIYAYVGFDFAGLAPNFRRARAEKKVEFIECSEYILMASLEAAARDIPFMPVRSGLGSDLLRVNPNIKEIISPFGDEKLVAVKAVRPDVALLHVNAADARGWGQILGDRMLDPLYSRAARTTILSAEKIVPTEYIEEHSGETAIHRLFTSNVVEAPHGAGFTSCFPDYAIDVSCMYDYLQKANSAETFSKFLEQICSRPEQPVKQ